MTIDRVQALMQALDAQLRVSRQAERLAMFDLRVATQQKPSQPGTTGGDQ